MTLAEFRATLRLEEPPRVESLLQALWFDAIGNWRRAHELVQDVESRDAAWVHAYLHRKEGDHGNAAYWYDRAGQPVASDPLDAEWTRIASALLR